VRVNVSGIISIDPGTNGGIAFIKNEAVIVAKVWQTERDTYEILQSYAEHEPFAYIESVQYLHMHRGRQGLCLF